MGAFLGIKGTITLALIAVIAVAIWGFSRQLRKMIEPAPKPRMVSVGPLKVISVNTGASIVVPDGRRGKTQIAHLQYVQAPVDGPWAVASTDHLKQMAGSEIVVQHERRGIFRGTDKSGNGVWEIEGQKIDPKIEREIEEVEINKRKNAAGKPQPDCDICGGTGAEVIDGAKIAQAMFAVWIDNHTPSCQQCKNADKEEKLCPDGRAKWNACVAKVSNFKPYKQKCLCVGTWVEDRRGPLTGIVFGSSGINLNMAQVSGGYADCTADAPKAYQQAKVKAQKEKKGVWAK